MHHRALFAATRTAVVIDDDPDVQRLVARALEVEGVVSVTFWDAESALAWMAQNPVPDIAIVDMHLPTMSGFAVCRELRANPRTSSMPLVLATARQEISDALAASAVGALFLRKPFRLAELRAAVAAALSPAPLRPRILIVDDDVGIRDALAGIVDDEGYEAVCAADGLEALAVLRGNSPVPRLVLLDVMMPRMDGITFASRLRAHASPSVARVPLVMLSAHEDLALHAKRAGAVARFRKPLQLDALVTVIRSVMIKSSSATG